MVWGELFIAFVIAFVLSIIFGAAFRWERPGRPGLWPSMFFLFVIIFLVTWAIGGWVTPVGPSMSGIYWLSFLIVGVIVALILAAAIPPRRRPRNIEEAKRQAESASETQAMLGAFFWILFIAMIIILIWRYSYH